MKRNLDWVSSFLHQVCQRLSKLHSSFAWKKKSHSKRWRARSQRHTVEKSCKISFRFDSSLFTAFQYFSTDCKLLSSIPLPSSPTVPPIEERELTFRRRGIPLTESWTIVSQKFGMLSRALLEMGRMELYDRGEL